MQVVLPCCCCLKHVITLHQSLTTVQQPFDSNNVHSSEKHDRRGNGVGCTCVLRLGPYIGIQTGHLGKQLARGLYLELLQLVVAQRNILLKLGVVLLQLCVVLLSLLVQLTQAAHLRQQRSFTFLFARNKVALLHTASFPDSTLVSGD